LPAHAERSFIPPTSRIPIAASCCGPPWSTVHLLKTPFAELGDQGAAIPTGACRYPTLHSGHALSSGQRTSSPVVTAINDEPSGHHPNRPMDSPYSPFNAIADNPRKQRLICRRTSILAVASPRSNPSAARGGDNRWRDDGFVYCLFRPAFHVTKRYLPRHSVHAVLKPSITFT
jgi:hypothetical protein